MYPIGTSNLKQWPMILWAVESSPFPHRKMLDVGAGWGTAAILLRAHLNDPPAEIHAIEPDPDAFVYTHRGRTLYDYVACTTAQEFAGHEFAEYDTVLMADVIEHMTIEDGRAVLAKIPGCVVVSTPVYAGVDEHARTAAIPELERHVSQWTAEEIRRVRPFDAFWSVEGQQIYRLPPLTAIGKGRE